MSCHQPLRPMSCRRRAVTAMVGTRNTMLAIPQVTIETRFTNSMNHQYSERRARPSKLGKLVEAHFNCFAKVHRLWLLRVAVLRLLWLLIAVLWLLVTVLWLLWSFWLWWNRGLLVECRWGWLLLLEQRSHFWHLHGRSPVCHGLVPNV